MTPSRHMFGPERGCVLVLVPFWFLACRQCTYLRVRRRRVGYRAYSHSHHAGISLDAHVRVINARQHGLVSRSRPRSRPLPLSRRRLTSIPPYLRTSWRRKRHRVCHESRVSERRHHFYVQSRFSSRLLRKMWASVRRSQTRHLLCIFARSVKFHQHFNW